MFVPSEFSTARTNFYDTFLIYSYFKALCGPIWLIWLSSDDGIHEKTIPISLKCATNGRVTDYDVSFIIVKDDV